MIYHLRKEHLCVKHSDRCAMESKVSFFFFFGRGRGGSLKQNVFNIDIFKIQISEHSNMKSHSHSFKV